MGELIDEQELLLWEDHPDTRVRERVLSCARALADRDFPVIAVPALSDANRHILARIDRHRTVFYWKAATLDELGILETLSARGNTVRDAMPLVDRRQLLQRRAKQMPASAVYMSGVCAITVDGVLVKVEPEGMPLFQPGSRARPGDRGRGLKQDRGRPGRGAEAGQGPVRPPVREAAGPQPAVRERRALRRMRYAPFHLLRSNDSNTRAAAAGNARRPDRGKTWALALKGGRLTL